MEGHTALSRKYYIMFSLIWAFVTADVAKENHRREWLIKIFTVYRGKVGAFMPDFSFVHRCELGLLHAGSFLRECFRQCSGTNYSGRPCEKFQVKLASQASWCHFTLEVAFLYGRPMH